MNKLKLFFFLILFDFYLCVLKDSHFITIFERGWAESNCSNFLINYII